MATNIVNRTKERYLQYEKRHQEILDAAINIFNMKGYKGATTAEIAKTAGISEPILYKHFENKKDLFLEAFRSITDYLYVENKKIYNKYKDDEIRFITEVIRLFIRFLKQNPHKTMFLIHMLSNKNDHEFKGFYEDLMVKFIDLFEEVLLALKKKGKYKSKVKPRTLATIFTGQYFTAIAVKDLLGTREFTAKNFVESLLDMLMLK
jgi:AcrR family transcriptional regulator